MQEDEATETTAEQDEVEPEEEIEEEKKSPEDLLSEFEKMLG
jgi:hypothetical protein